MSNDAKQRFAALSEEQRQRLARRLVRARDVGARVQIARQPRNGATFPLSFAQQRIWFLNQLAPLNSAFNIGQSIRLRGPFDLDALTGSLAEIVRRHDSLRTTFESVDGVPRQRIAPHLDVPLALCDLEDLPAGQREAEAARQMAEENRRPWSLETGPLFRAKVWRIAATDHMLLLVLHHIISDGWSWGVIGRELTTLYRAFSAGQASPLTELPIQYPDYSVWQRQWVETDGFQRQLDFWKSHYRDLPRTSVASDYRGDGPAEGARGIHRWLRLSPDLTARLRALSQRENATLFMTLLAAFSTLLSRYTGQDDIVVGTPIANRNRVEVENLIGCFMNPLPLRVRLDGNPTFQELLQRVRDVALNVYSHQDVPFDLLVRALQPKREPGTAPLFQVMFLLQNFAWEPIDLSSEPEAAADWTVEQVAEVERSSLPTTDLVYPIALEAFELGPVVACSFQYSTAFTTAFSRVPGQFQTLLEAIVADPGARVADLPLLTPSAHREVLDASSGPVLRSALSAPLVPQMFERQAELTPDAIAVVAEGEQLTYRELNARANRLAGHLRKAGVGPEILVGILLERSLDMLTAVLAVLKAGGAYVPLDPSYPVERLAFILRDAGASVLVTTGSLLSAVPLPESGTPTLFLDRQPDVLSPGDERNPTCDVDEDNLAYVLYTSGSTGVPKGVEVTHRALANYTYVASEAFRIDASDRVLQFASFSFDTAAEEIYPCLMRGATLVLRTDAMLASVPLFLRNCREWRITVLDLPTAYWHELARQMCDGGLDLPPDVRLVILGGERAQLERARAWQERFGTRVRLVNTYGPSEATIVSTMFDVPPAGDRRWGSAEVPIGAPIPNSRILILDQQLRLAPIGAPGELHIGGAGLARGYHNRPDLTADRFIPDPFSPEPGSRLYKTGDGARYLEGGIVEFLGRIDHQIKLRGFRIELTEVEAVLTGDARVADAVVLLRDDDPNDRRLVAYVVARDASVTAADLRDRLRTSLPDYMVPSAIVLLPALPLTPNGKVDRNALPLLEGTRQSSAPFMSPRTETEHRLAELWQELLHVERVGLDDNFFDLGGHSLLVVQLHSRLRAMFGDQVSVIDLFKLPTVRVLAQALARQETDATEPALRTIQDRASQQRDAFARRRVRVTTGSGLR